jgi:two-component system, NarL family, sensor kinase
MSRVPRVLGSPRWVAAAAVALAVVTLVVLGQMYDPDAAAGALIRLTAAIAVSYTPMGALVLAGVRGHLVGRLMVAAGVMACVAVLAASWSGWLPLAWLAKWSWWPPLGLIFLALLVFPDGRLPSRRWRPLAVILWAATAVAGLALALAAFEYPRTLLTTDSSAYSPRVQVLLWVARRAIVVAIAGLVAVLSSLWVRWRRADAPTRQQLACLLPACGVFILALVLDLVGLTGAWAITAVVVPVGMTIAVLRYRLYGLDQVVNRSIVWLVMSVLVIIGFVAIVALLRDAVMGGSTSHASLAATGLIAVTFEPVRRRVQRGVDHLLYGDLDDPYKVMARLGDLVGRTVEPNAVLPLLTEAIARSLQVPYVAVEFNGRDAPRLLAEYGTATTTVESFDMVAHGQQVGRLLVATRSPGTHFTSRECRLLRDLALQAAVAAEATQLIHDLQKSRERLIMAREEERRRLRRDLHDGLGPALAGMSMQVRAAHKLITGTSRVAGILGGLTRDLQRCTAEVRQLVDGLRPPALDRGLAAALHAECQRFDGPTLSAKLCVVGDLDGLPAAVEVAAYRIVAEALTNVAHHAAARNCRITVGRLRSLTIEIVDDGVGLIAPATGGVGLSSMRERAAELGGECVIGRAEAGGTAVRVSLPIPAAQVVLR